MSGGNSVVNSSDIYGIRIGIQIYIHIHSILSILGNTCIIYDRTVQLILHMLLLCYYNVL